MTFRFQIQALFLVYDFCLYYFFYAFCPDFPVLLDKYRSMHRLSLVPTNAAPAAPPSPHERLTI